MKKQITKITKKVLTVCLCLLISFGSIPLSGFVGLELPDLPEFDFGFLKASAATKELSEDGEFYISSINTTNKTASFAGVVDESVSFDDDFYCIPNKTMFDEEVYIITGIDNSAFQNSSIKKVAIHSDIVTIGNSAFRDCAALSTVVFDERTDDQSLEISSNAFSGCTLLETINLEDSNAASVGSNSFNNCKNLQMVILPETASEISDFAFQNCKSLSVVDLKNVTTIGMSAFAGTALTTVNIPSGVTTIGTRAFNGSKLTSVFFDENSKISTIGQFAFLETNITEVKIPATVETIGQGAFENCTSLENVIFEKRTDDQSLEISSNAFSGCTLLESINLEDSNATSVNGNLFYNCQKLQSVILPETASGISEFAFQNCKSLSAVDLKNVTTIGMSAFAGTALTTVNIPSSVTTIGTRAFNESKLTSVVFDENSKISTIGQYAFLETGITEFTIPATVKTIGHGAFKDCTSLENVIFEKRTDDQPIEIGLQAFSGCISLKHINLHDSNATSMANESFFKCKSLTYVRLPSTLEVLGTNVFNGCKSIKLYMDTAEPEVAVTIIDEGWPFEIKETEIKDSESRNLNPVNTYYKLSQKLSPSKNGVSLTLEYDFKETVKSDLSNCNISVKVPSTVAFNTAAVMVNGVEWSDVSTGSSGTVLNIKNVPSSSTIEFKVNITDASCFVSYAKIGYKLNGKSYNEVIGIINSINDIITLKTPSETNKKDITVSGMASPEKNVDLYINGEYCKTVTTSKTGAYSEELTLPVSGSAETFNIEAKINGGKNTTSSRIVYSNDAVMITSAKMIYRGQEYDLIANQGKLPVISWSAGASFSFIIKVDNPDAVKAIYIVSPKAGGNNTLLCEYNEKLDAYTATGFKGVVPSNLSVRCITNNNYEKIESDFNYDNSVSEEVRNAISDIVVGEIKENTIKEDKENGKFVYEVSNKNNPDEKLTIKMDNIPTDNVTVDSLENNPSYTYSEKENGSGFFVKQQVSKNDSGCVEVYHKNEEGEIDTGFEVFLGGFITMFNSIVPLLDLDCDGIPDITSRDSISEEIGTTLFEKVLSFLFGYGTNDIFYTLLKAESVGTVFDNMANGTAMGGLFYGFAVKLAKLIFLDEEPSPADILMCAAHGIGFAFTITFPGAAVPTLLILTVTDLISSLSESGFLDMNFRFIIDPSGIIYEAVPSNTVEDATVTALWIPYDEKVPEFWNEDYPDISKAKVWNAEEYDQTNPLKTLDDGSYSWEVPEGWWLVKAEKEGYEATYSEWMDIPPERFDVNLGLVSKSAPEVEYINVYENEIEIAFTQYMNIKSVNSENINVLLNGKTVEGVFNPKNEERTADNQMSYASNFSFVPASVINGSIDINISGVENYCGTKFEGEFSRRNNFVLKVESLSVEGTVLAAINSDNTITVSAYPASAAAGKKVFVTLSNDLIASVDCSEITLDENGQGIVSIHTELPGDVIISFVLENSDLTSSAIIVVGSGENSVQPKPEVFSIKWIVDGISNEQFVEAGSEIIRPQNPSKDGYTFIGWTPAVPETMPAYDLTFTAVFEKSYICPDCGDEILGENEINEHKAAEARMKATVKIKNNNGSNTIKYGETLRLTAITTNMPADAKIYWYVDGVKRGEGETFNVSFENGTKNVEVKLVDSSGNILKNASGDEIKDSESVTVRGGFFQKIISFFKNLFGMNRTVVQAIFKGVL